MYICTECKNHCKIQCEVWHVAVRDTTLVHVNITVKAKMERWKGQEFNADYNLISVK